MSLPRPLRRPLAEPGRMGAAWRWALGITAAIAAIVACLLPLANTLWDGRLAVDDARSPLDAAQEWSPGAPYPADTIALRGASVIDSEQGLIYLVWLHNLDPAAPPPPGLARWPGPREVVASPGLVRSEAGRRLAAGFGPLVGTVGEAGLVSPHEALLYVGADPAHLDEGQLRPIVGFGVPRSIMVDQDGNESRNDEGELGDVAYQGDRSEIFAVLTLFAVAPCLVLIGVVARLGGERRDQYAAWLSVIGAPPTAIVRFLLREALLPVCLGAALGLAAVGLAMAGTWPIPGTGEYLVGALIRPAWPWCVLGAAGAAVAVLAAVLSANRVRRRPLGASAKAAPRRARPWLLVVPIALIVGHSWGYRALERIDSGGATTFSMLMAAAAIVVLAPCSGAFLTMTAAAVRHIARRRSSPMALVSSRELGALPRPALRIAAVVAAAVVVTAQAITFAAGASAGYHEELVRADSDPRLAVTLGEAGGLAALAAAELPENYATAVLAGRTSPDGKPAIVRTTCEQARRLGALDCSGRRATVAQLIGGQRPVARAGLSRAIDPATAVEFVDSLSDLEGEVAVLATDGHRIDIGALSGELSARVTPVPSPVSLSATAIGFLRAMIDQLSWYVVAGGVTALILGVAAVLALWFESLRVARRMASLAMMMDRRRKPGLLGVGLVGIPIGVATIIGIAAAIGLTIAPATTPGSAIGMPWAYFAVAVAVGAALSSVAGLITGRAIRSHGARWVPADEDA